MSKCHRVRMFLVFVLISPFVLAHAQEMRRILDLRGKWKFELGNDPRWADSAFDDSRWDAIRVPSPWEEQGYPGYDGYAWYRRHFNLSVNLREVPVYLSLGYIDDVAEVYLNGVMVGFTGRFPPRFHTGAGLSQQYLLPKKLLLPQSDNVVAVKVYDHYQAGGIVRGDIGLYEPEDYLKPDLDLSGRWKFSTGDDMRWAEESFDDARWNSLLVPGLWDLQGYREYDGFAWYRIRFKVPANLSDHKLVLLLGKIDDVDETYLNGTLIGRTGPIYKGIRQEDLGKEWLEPRAYTLPPSLLRLDEENTLAVRVCDVWLHGGIYDGPIGLAEKDRYTSWNRKPKSFWDFLRSLF